MERLTHSKYESGITCYPKKNGVAEILIGEADTFWQCIKKLKEYEDLEEQGKLLKLPCKVGDTVWVIEEQERKICRCIVKSIEFSDFSSFALIEKDMMYGERMGYIRVPLGNFGKTVFLTKEQADAALQALKETEGENGD